MQMVLGFLTVGPGELAVIAIIALIVFGPEKLPEIGKQIGMAYRELNRLRGDVNRALGEIDEYTRFELPDYTTPTEQTYSYHPPALESGSYRDDDGDGDRMAYLEAASTTPLPGPPGPPALFAVASENDATQTISDYATLPHLAPSAGALSAAEETAQNTVGIQRA